MSRPRKDLSVRFSDVMPIWRAVEHAGSFETQLGSSNKAISTMQRLHKARAALRDQDDEGFCFYDKFVIRIEGARLKIIPREIPDTNQFYTTDGRKIDYAEVEKSFEESRRIKEALEKNQSILGLNNKGEALQKLYSPKPPPPDDHPEEALDTLEVEDETETS